MKGKPRGGTTEVRQMDYRDQWRRMLLQSWSPLVSSVDLDDLLEDDHDGSERGRWLFRPTEDRRMYEVGFYSHDWRWVLDSYHVTKHEAADRVRFLNGGD